MGALHQGHLSLVRAARRQTDFVVVSIFVNRLQFGPKEDYARYPRNLPRDMRLLRPERVDVVFSPEVRAMYPLGFHSRIEVKGLGDILEGRARPGHFRGVATVVGKLFHLVQPTTAYFGQKDYQQVRIIQQMVQDLNWPMRIRVMPTLREPDGLAMSSRNVCLEPEERRQAAVLFQALSAARAAIRRGERRATRLHALMRSVIRAQPLVRLETLDVVDAQALSSLTRLRGHVAILGSVRVGRTRLIDNILVDVP